jgi:hypothetical protein
MNDLKIPNERSDDSASFTSSKHVLKIMFLFCRAHSCSAVFSKNRIFIGVVLSDELWTIWRYQMNNRSLHDESHVLRKPEERSEGCERSSCPEASSVEDWNGLHHSSQHLLMTLQFRSLLSLCVHSHGSSTISKEDRNQLEKTEQRIP